MPDEGGARLRMLLVGPQSGTTSQRARAFVDLGHEVVTLDTGEPLSGIRSLISRVSYRLRRPLDSNHVNRAIVRVASEQLPDLVWVEKGLLVQPQTLAEVRRVSPTTRIVSYSPDDMFNPSNQSRAYLQSIPLYDVHVTTKTYNVDELTAAGARRVLFTNNAFDPHTHRPLELTDAEIAKYGSEVAFIGGFEDDRAQHILALAEAGIEVTVWCAHWPKRGFNHPRIRVKREFLAGIEYSKGIVGSRICLGFLRKCNRDRQTTRTMEIPACGVFMLAERTEEHRQLFTEGKEAEFFESAEELVEKCRFYLGHEENRRAVAAAGRRRCIEAGYGNPETLCAVLDRIL